MQAAPIGVFDSGYGGLTVLKEMVKVLPQYDYIYLGDNARTPYGNRSFETVYEYTLQCVKWFLNKGCALVILACNTASAKALRTIQQRDLPSIAADKRILGVIRPTTESIGRFSRSGEVGILATTGTVASQSYPIEIAKFFPEVKVYQQACPMWVPIVENNEIENEATDYFVKEYLEKIFEKGREIDVLLLACTHYPLLTKKIKQFTPPGVQIISQGEIVANSLKDYLKRHPEIDEKCSKNGKVEFFTTDSADDFDTHAELFFGSAVASRQVELHGVN